MRVWSLALRRLAASLPTLVVILIGLFLLLQLAPGDTVDALVAQMGGGDTAMAEELRRFYGLDATVAVQLGRYLWRLVRLDLGFSAIYGKPVATVILERLPATLLLMGSALSLAIAGGTALGILAARRVNRWPDTLISTLGLIFYATPSFWFGLLCIVLFAVKLGWLPAGGFEEIGTGYAGLRRALDIALHLLLPTATLALVFLATYLRLMRASMLEVMTLDFVRTARAKGLSETAVVCRHALPNALVPIVTVVGLQFGALLAGAIVTETIFSWPGLGRLTVSAISNRDYALVQGCLLSIGLTYVLVNLLTDAVYRWVNPRMRG